MIESIKTWLVLVAGVSFGATVLELLSPRTKGGLEKYVKFVCAVSVLAAVAGPLFTMLSSIADNLPETGIFSNENNINITESNQSQKWILSQTLTDLEKGIKKLVKERFGADIDTEFDTAVSPEGIEIKKIYLSSPVLLYARKAEIAMFLEDYFNIEVRVKDAE